MHKKALETMLGQGKDSAMLRFTLGLLLMKENSMEEAVVHLKQGLSQDPGHSASWKAYARALTLLKRTEEAIVAYEEGISVAEERGDVQAAREMRVFLKRLQKKA